MNLPDFLRAYRYGQRGSKLTGWLDLRREAQPVGDCEDFALTVLLLVEGGWLRAIWAVLTLRAVFWFVDSPAGQEQPRHTILWHRRHGWIDTHYPYWRFGTEEAPAPRLTRPLAWIWSWFRHPARMDMWFPWAWLALPLMLWGAGWRAVNGNGAVPRQARG